MCHVQVSDLVECIDNTPIHKQSKTMPELGQVYRVDSVRLAGDGYSVRLVELTPDCYKGGGCTCGHCGWDAARFRKIYRPDDNKLAVFRAMLDAPAALDTTPKENCPTG
jgi:hypothetical protein